MCDSDIGALDIGHVPHWVVSDGSLDAVRRLTNTGSWALLDTADIPFLLSNPPYHFNLVLNHFEDDQCIPLNEKKPVIVLFYSRH